MALMFSRLARNFARNGYYPTDKLTLERTLQALVPASSGRMRILDPCSGEGVALAEVAHRLSATEPRPMPLSTTESVLNTRKPCLTECCRVT